MFAIEFTLKALKDLRNIDVTWQKRIRESIKELANKPDAYPGIKHIKGGPKNRFRIRVGDYRIVFDKEKEIKILLILRIGHRKEIYRSFE